jgi:hypothetical protein
VKAINVADTTDFENVITIQVETKAYDLVYSPQQYMEVQQKQAKQSTEPTIKGTAPITYSLKEDFGAFVIDEKTGLISLPAGHALDINTYNLTVVATNAHGSVEFANAVSFGIVEIKAILPSDLQYANASYAVNEGFAFATEVPTVSGSTPMTFALADNYGAFDIDANTGVISLVEGNALTIGTYPLTVNATNLKGTATFDNVISISVKAAVEEQVFEDGWDGVSPAAGEKRLGNMVEYSSIEIPVQASNNKWNRGWGNWTVLDREGNSARGAVMIPQKTENDDWLIAPSVDLTSYVRSKLYFSGYSKYGIDDSTLKLFVSEDYSGNPETATWVEVAYDQLPTTSPAQDREVDMSQFDGKSVTIALRHESRLAEGLTVDKFTRTHFILHFEVKAFKK